VKGGKAGQSGCFIVNPGTAQECRIAPFGDNLELHYGDVLRLMTSGGGGWGNPAERDPLQVLQDVKDGFVSLHSAREAYGVVIEADTWKIDWRQTQDLRRVMPASPPLFDRGAAYEDLEQTRQQRYRERG
jgi:N-methylhydantoinase B/oxoprolinase/acetone carboxylase alpha subunit